MANSRLGISNSGFNPHSVAGSDGSGNQVGIVVDIILDDNKKNREQDISSFLYFMKTLKMILN